MSNDVKPPVEPMSDLSWARVEKGLWARLDTATAPAIDSPRSRRWIWIAVPSIAVAAAIAAVFAFAFDAPKTTTNGEPLAITHDNAPTRIVSGAAPSTISIGDAHVTLDADSAVVMPRANDTTSTAVLERGAAWFAIAPRTGRQFVVVAGDTTVRVVGTKFRVARSVEHATVEVERGVVEVTYQDTTVKLTAGQSWTSQPGQPGQPAQPAPAPVPAPVAIIEPAKAAPAPVIEKPAKKTTVASTDDDQTKFERAQAIETTDPSAALRTYLEVARGTSVWAQVSLYAATRLAHDRGEAARAKTLAEAYLRRFPHGKNAIDTRKLLDRLKGAP